MTLLIKNVVTGDGRQTVVKALVDMYRDVLNNSVPVGGKIKRIRQNKYSLTSRFTTADLDNMVLVNTSKSYLLASNEHGIEFIESLTDSNSIADTYTAQSNNGRFLARLKTPKPDHQLLEIWDRSKLLKTLNINEIDSHGLINIDPHFSSFCWSPFENQDKFLYICQSKEPKHSSFFNEKPSLESSSDKPDLRGQETVKKDDWGEQLNGIVHTILCVLDVSNDCKITTFDFGGLSLANSKWFYNGTKIVSVGYQETPRKLGIIYCNNRPSKIVIHDLECLSSKVLELDYESSCYHSVRVNHAGDKFIYLSNAKFGPHYHSQRINLYDYKTGESKQLIDEATNNANFFIERLNDDCFTMNDQNILFVSSDHLNQHMYLYNIHGGLLSKIKFPTSGVSILDFNYDIIMALGSDLNASPTIFVAKLNSSDLSDVVGWHQIEDCIHLAEIDYEQYKIPTDDGKSFISAVLIKPQLPIIQNDYPFDSTNDNQSEYISDNNKLPTVVMVHGGPHSAFNIKYSDLIVVYSRIGLNVLLVNYRGSTGVSQEYIECLNGRVGELDVQDCMTAIRYFVKQKMIDSKKLVIFGGSHGGFITAHLCCQDEFKFTSAILRNPVIDISTLQQTSDIPDWSYSVALGHKNNFDFSWRPASKDLLRMFECSPMSKIEKANVPTLMLLGNKDVRVNLYQGEKWHNLLKAKGIDTMCKIYNDGHALDKVEVKGDLNITSLIWILDHLPKN